MPSVLSSMPAMVKVKSLLVKLLETRAKDCISCKSVSSINNPNIQGIS